MVRSYAQHVILLCEIDCRTLGGLLFLYNYVIHRPHICMQLSGLLVKLSDLQKQAYCQSKLHFNVFSMIACITCTTG